MPKSASTDRLPVSPDRSLAAFAALAILTWVALEFAFRRGIGPVIAEAVGIEGIGDPVLFGVAFPLIAGLISWWGTRVGIDRDDWDYETSRRAVGAGLGGFLVWAVMVAAAATAYVAVVGVDSSVAASTGGSGGLPAWGLALFVLGNGVVVPISEELAWRGVIQTALTESYGTYVAVVVTALAFVGKHLIVDMAAPLFRVTSLLVLAFVLCGLRARYGTTSSTVAHIAINLLSTVAFVLA